MTGNKRFLLLILLTLLLPVAAWGQTTSRQAYARLMEVQELWNTQQYEEARQVLEKLVGDTARRNNPYDHLVANQYMAQTGVLLDDLEISRRALETALSMEELDDYPALASDLKMLYGQILANEDNFEKAALLLEQWYETNKNSGSAATIFLVAYVNFMLNNFSRAVQVAEHAFSLETEPPDTWCQVYYQALFELQEYEKAEQFLLETLAHDTGNDLIWRMLSNHYMQLDDINTSLTVLSLEYLQDMISDPDDLLRLSNLYSYAGVPERGARLLEQWLAEKKVQPEAETLIRLGNLWLAAREKDKARVSLREAAGQSNDSRTWELLAGIYFNNEQWQEAYITLQNALNAKNINDKNRLQFLTGVSAFRAGLGEEAVKHLKEVADVPDYASQANAMILQIEQQAD